MKFRVTITTSGGEYVVEDADQVMLKDGILVAVKGNETLCFNWNKIDYYTVKEKEAPEQF